MAPIKYFRYASLLLLSLLWFTACSTDKEVTFEEEEALFTENQEQIIVTTQEAEPTVQDFTVRIEGRLFEATDLKAYMEGDKLHILASNEIQHKSVFLTFRYQQSGAVTLGHSKENEQRNVAGYLLENQDIGYMTSEMFGNCGEITFEAQNGPQKTISGTFHFSASNNENKVLSFTEGSFSNIVFTP